MVKLKSDKHQSEEIKKLIDCKICQEMFQYEFNYENLLKDDSKLKFIKSFFEEISETDFNLKDYMSKDNLDFVTKEISMQYFFKGEDSLFASEEQMEKFKNCKNFKNVENTENKSLTNNQCEIMKLKVCENVLNIEDGFCVNFNKKILLIKNKASNIPLIESKDHTAIAYDSSNDLLTAKNLKELDLVKKNNKEKFNDLKNSKENKEDKSNQNDNYKRDNSYNQNVLLNDNNINSSFIANENIDALNKANNIINSNKIYKQDKNDFEMEESFRKLIELKNAEEQQILPINALNTNNLRSKQINKFISLGFNRDKQDKKPEKQLTSLEQDFDSLLLKNNIIKSKLIILK